MKLHFSREVVGLDLLFAAQEGFFSWILAALADTEVLLGERGDGLLDRGPGEGGLVKK